MRLADILTSSISTAYARLSYIREKKRKETNKGKEKRERSRAVEPRVRDTRVSLEGQGQRYLRYLIGSELLKSREGGREWEREEEKEREMRRRKKYYCRRRETYVTLVKNIHNEQNYFKLHWAQV